MLAEKRTSETDNTIDAALAWHDGDARATIESLLRDCGFLREQLFMARGCMSRGLTRGWMPQFEQNDSGATSV